MWGIMQECWRQEPDSRPPINTLSGRIISAANRKTINLGSNWDDSLPSLLRRNIRYPEICPSGSLADAFLFGPRYQSTNLEHSLETKQRASTIPSKPDFVFATSHKTDNSLLISTPGLMPAPPFPSGQPPSEEYLSQPLSQNPLGLLNMVPREWHFYSPGRDGALPETPWVWNPTNLYDESDEEHEEEDTDSSESNSERSSPSSPHQQISPRKHASEDLVHPTPVTALQAEQHHRRPLQLTVSSSIIRTPDHYRNTSTGLTDNPSRSSNVSSEVPTGPSSISPSSRPPVRSTTTNASSPKEIDVSSPAVFIPTRPVIPSCIPSSTPCPPSPAPVCFPYSLPSAPVFIPPLRSATQELRKVRFSRT
ncbi:hypothetical protein K435DRAFT_387937 [Dendrothele bispora CBS 962.96]|uniref:Uncharacterized protein n=1 Tax=Dendrothele bispora (strain CBS 962.96) TaxID=1314807 RepID=A0A4V6T546_DENBC|nr:hypothetical protein K435DRAFT_387937 [Dendrothele bispora CBS 962.96]